MLRLIMGLSLLAALAGCRSTELVSTPGVVGPGGVTTPSPYEGIDERERGIDFSTSRFKVPGPEEIEMKFRKLIGLGPNEEKARELFAEGDALMAEKRYRSAARKYKSAGKRLPYSPLEEDALFMQAEAHFFNDKYRDADDSYERLLKKYDNSRHLDTVMSRQFAIGRYWEGRYDAFPIWPIVPNLVDSRRPLFDTLGNAIKCYESVHQHDPTGPLADDAVMAVANAYFLHDRYEDADFYYGVLRSDYPESEHQPNAHVLGLRCKFLCYQGSDYDSAPLLEAKDLVRQTELQFAATMPDELGRLRAAQDAVDTELAQREFLRGEYYAKLKRYGAARFHYETIVDQYPATEFSQLAQQRMQNYADEPASPPDRLEWLTNLLDYDNKLR